MSSAVIGTLKTIACVIAVVAILAFLYWLIRELGADALRVRRSARTRQVETPIAREYTGKDWPAWERNLDLGRYRALARKLEDLGE